VGGSTFSEQLGEKRKGGRAPRRSPARSPCPGGRRAWKKKRVVCYLLLLPRGKVDGGRAHLPHQRKKKGGETAAVKASPNRKKMRSTLIRDMGGGGGKCRLRLLLLRSVPKEEVATRPSRNKEWTSVDPSTGREWERKNTYTFTWGKEMG